LHWHVVGNNQYYCTSRYLWIPCAHHFLRVVEKKASFLSETSSGQDYCFSRMPPFPGHVIQLPNRESEPDTADEPPVPERVAPRPEDMIPVMVTPVSSASPPEKPFGWNPHLVPDLDCEYRPEFSLRHGKVFVV
jgi:hypothetical protein